MRPGSPWACCRHRWVPRVRRGCHAGKRPGWPRPRGRGRPRIDPAVRGRAVSGRCGHWRALVDAPAVTLTRSRRRPGPKPFHAGPPTLTATILAPMTPEAEISRVAGAPAGQPGRGLRPRFVLAIAAGLSLILAGGFPGLAAGQGPLKKKQVPLRGPVPTLPVSAEAVLLLDLETGKVLFEKNAEEDRAPASLVKMMTLYIAYEEIRAGRVSRGEQ